MNNEYNEMKKNLIIVLEKKKKLEEEIVKLKNKDIPKEIPKKKAINIKKK